MASLNSTTSPPLRPIRALFFELANRLNPHDLQAQLAIVLHPGIGLDHRSALGEFSGIGDGEFFLTDTTPLMVASSLNRLALVTALLEEGAAIDLQDEAQSTALQLAIDGIGMDTRVVEALLDNGADSFKLMGVYDQPNKDEVIRILKSEGELRFQ